jgi:2-iminobutanoate/2-iminopropanoate deaminase
MAHIQFVTPPNTPPVIGPYSPATVCGSMVFVSGQIPRDAAGKIVSDSIENATKQVLENLKTVLAAAGCGFTEVVKTTVFLQDLNDFDGMNTVYTSFFQGHRPARSTIQVAKLPANSRVEIECIAVKNS